MFAALVLDATLPGLDGVAVCSELRAAQVTTPVLVLTGPDDSKQRVRALECGADDCMCRPFSVDELLARIRALIRRDQFVRSTKLVIDDLVVDSAACTVTRGGRDVALTHREFALLEGLATRLGEVLTRAEIQEQLWGDGYSLSNNVDVHIRNLRRKIEPDPTRPTYIVTEPGVGYRLKVL